MPLSRFFGSRATLEGMIDLLTDGGALLLVMIAAAVFAAMAWIGNRVS